MAVSVQQILYITLNIGLILLSVGLMFLCLKICGIKHKQTRLLFILHTMYWVAPLVTSDYTGLIQIHMELTFSQYLLFVPLVVCALVGMIYRLFVDPLSNKIKSRKIIFIVSLILEVATMLPMFIKPCFTTNVIQSVGAGIGSGGISLFALMNEDQHESSNQSKIFQVLILLLPAILAQIIASGFICIIVSLIQEMHLSVDYLDKARYMWLVACVFIVISFVLVLFYKDQNKSLIYQSTKQKQVKKQKNTSFFVVLSISALLFSIVKWIASGPTASIQIAYIATKTGVDTRGYEGYASLAGALGEAIGVILVALFFKGKRDANRKKCWWLMLISLIAGIMYFISTSIWITIPVFILTGIGNGLCYGLATSMILRLVLTKSFKKSRAIFSPVGVYNTSLGIGIVAGTFLNCFIKSGIFDQIHGFSTFGFNEFVKVNWIVNSIGLGCLLAGICLLCIYFGKKYPLFPNKKQHKLAKNS